MHSSITRPVRLLQALLLLLASLLASPIGHAQSTSKSIVVTEQVRAELMAHAPQGVSAGQDVWVGLQLTHQPEWHTYWKNAGDSGLPTMLEWTLPPGIEAGDIAWPVPHKIAIGTLANYGYEGQVLLPVPLKITSAFKAGLLASDIEVKLKAYWLVCRKECIPQEGEFSLKLPLKSSTALNAGAFEGALAASPRPSSATATATFEGQNLKLHVQGLPAALQGKTLALFPETPEVLATAADWTQTWAGSVWSASLPLSRQRSQSPGVLPLVLAVQNQSYLVDATVKGGWPEPATGLDAPALTTPAPPMQATPPGKADLGLLAAIFGALLGGLILNLMPCVFPVLAIKVLGFARHADDRHAHRVSGFAYSAGVVASFLVLGAMVLGLRAAGEHLGWGFQLQSPAVVAGLAALFTAIGLNLSGLFQVTQLMPSALATLEARNPAVNAFLSGILAVAVASPCTAPFMGASLGLAVALPAAQALLVFAAIGVGMALPYLLASLVPAVARLLPRPGAWMEVFRKFMAFPMLATVVWLVWVLGQQTGIDGAAALLALLVAMAAALWALGLPGRTAHVLGGLTLALLALTAWTLGPYVLKSPDERQASDQVWRTWEPGKVEQQLSGGRPVLVDFTAAWCVTCQYNKRTTLANPEVLTALQGKNVALLRADWTRRDPAITAALSVLGRSGVPVYVFYAPGRAPVVLSEILQVDEVLPVIASL